MKFAVAVLSLCASTLRAQSPDIKFERLGSRVGLSQSSVYSILQDRTGFLWVGTFDGLNRYDGYQFKIFRHIPFDSTSLSDNFIHCLYESHDGRLWIGTDDGLNIYDPLSRKFTTIRPTGGRLPSPFVTALVSDPVERDWLWTGTDRGLVQIPLTAVDDSSSPWSSFTDQKLCSNASIKALAATNDGLFVGGPEGLWFIHCRSRRTFAISRDDVQALYWEAPDVLWVGSGQGLFRLTGGWETKVAKEKILNTQTFAIHRASDGALWIGTSEGLVIVSPSGVARTFRHDPLNSWSISANSIQQIFEDRRGTMWVGTEFGGLNKFTRRMGVLHHMSLTNGGLSDKYIYPILEDRDFVWMGTYGDGVTRWLKDRRQSTVIRFETRARNTVYALEKDKDDRLWIGTMGGGILVIDPSGRRYAEWVHHPSDPSTLSHNEVWCLLRDTSDGMWIGTTRGLNYFRQKRFQRFLPDSADPTAISGATIQSMCWASDGLWIGTWGDGLNFAQRAGGRVRFHHLRHGRRDSMSLSGNIIMCLTETKTRQLWIGTWGGGISILDSTRKRMDYLTEADGLSNNSVYGILEDDDGILWVTTNHGLNRIDPRILSIRVYDAGDGLPANEFNTGSYLRARDGEFWFGGIEGVVRFRSSDLHIDDIPPVTVITEIHLPGRVLDAPVVIPALAYDQNFLVFEFSALDFTNPARQQYQYQLEGVDEKWIHAGYGKTASYTALAPGQYTFRVRGSNSDGVWSLRPAVIEFEILPPFWRTSWFITLIVVSLVGLIAYAVMLRVRRIRRYVRLRTEYARMLITSQEEERRKIASTLHDSHGQNLLVLNNEFQRRLHAAQGIQVTKEDLEKWTRWIGESIEEVRTLAHDLRPVQLTQLGLARAVEGLLKKIDPPVKVEGNLELLQNVGENTDIHVYRILQEVFSNILRHSRATEIRFYIEHDDSHIFLHVRDNGLGFGGGLKPGMGLISMRERTRLFGGSFSIMSAPGQGTSIRFTVPLQEVK